MFKKRDTSASRVFLASEQFQCDVRRAAYGTANQ